MAIDSPQIIHRIVAALEREGGPRSSADLARRFLGVGLIDERLAQRLLDPLLAQDRRVERTARGWEVREGAGADVASAAAAGAGSSAALAAPFTVAFAPPRLPVALTLPIGDGAPVYTVALTGAAEAERAALLTCVPIVRPVLNLTLIARRLAGYRGVPDALAIAERLRVRHVEEDGADGAARLVGSIWLTLRRRLADEGIDDVSVLERHVADRLEATDFDGKEFSSADVLAVPAVPGVYVFRDARGRALYVGQSCSLAARVASYFTGPPRDEKDRTIRREAVRLATIETDTGLDARILELQTIRRVRPRLNTQLGLQRAAGATAILALPAAGDRAALIAYVLRDGALMRRTPIRPGPRRAPAAVAVAVAALFADSAQTGDREAGALAVAWWEARAEGVLLEPGVHGGPEHIAATLRGLC